MKQRERITLIAVATLMTFTITASASADTTATETATVTVPGGSLEIRVKPSSGPASSRSFVSGRTISAGLGEVKVSDTRSAPAGSGWVASVVSTAFTSQNRKAIPANRISYTAGTIQKTGTATYTANNPKDLQQAAPAVTASKISGSNTATWSPTIYVHLPSDAVAGTYTATLTHSVL